MMGSTNYWRSHRHGGCGTAVLLLLWLLLSATATHAKTLPLSGEHLVLVVLAVFGAYLMASMAIGPVNWSTTALLRQKQMMNRAYLKRPGRGVPPPRSGPRPSVVMYLYVNSFHAWGAS